MAEVASTVRIPLGPFVLADYRHGGSRRVRTPLQQVCDLVGQALGLARVEPRRLTLSPDDGARVGQLTAGFISQFVTNPQTRARVRREWRRSRPAVRTGLRPGEVEYELR